MQLKLVKKKKEVEGCFSFYFESNKKIEFFSGQYIYITLPKLNYEDERGTTRHFTISNSPTEEEFIVITTRIREESGYKKTLNELNIGDFVEGRGPLGSFIFNEEDNTKSHVFLAGGIGITPFRSMIKYNIDQKLNLPMYLVYSNSDSDFVFKNELDLWAEKNNNIKIEYVDTSKVGRIDNQKIDNILKKYNLTSKNCLFYAVGPSSFVDAVENVLLELNVSENVIKTEKFTGY